MRKRSCGGRWRCCRPGTAKKAGRDDSVSEEKAMQPSPLGEKLRAICHEIAEQAARASADYPFADRDCEHSRDNLLAYLALRERDLRELQLELAEQGLSSLGRLESNVLARSEEHTSELQSQSN